MAGTNSTPDQNQGSEEEYLKQYLQETDMSGKSDTTNDFTMPEGAEQFDTNRAVDLQYFAFDAKIFPMGIFYPEGTKILVRAAEVQEIQAYSMVDDTNFYDVVEKMNDIISSCVRVKYPTSNTPSTFLDLKDGDRFFAIFLIRELTFQKGNSLAVPVSCSCSKDVQVELVRANFIFHDIDEKIKKYFDSGKKKFVYKTKAKSQFEIGAPTIGLQKSFTDYILEDAKNKRTPNMSFLKIIPFIISDMNNISEEGIKKYLTEFQQMTQNDFQFLNAAVDKMKFGIKEMKKFCSCGLEVRTDFTFPNGASGIFLVHDAFERYIQE